MRPASRSEMGKIGRALGSIETEQPRLQRQIHSFVRVFAIIGVLLGGLIGAALWAAARFMA